MHPADMFILLSIGTAIGWGSAIYVNKDFRLMIAYIIGCPMAAGTAGYFTLVLYPEYGKVGMVAGALIGAILLRLIARYIIVRFMKKI
ncbi:MAG: hypothetical protein COB78_02880 [Hyphomicrobiales bacterium]|nr:MAG: hypothetical protein COB78_02880 [Hyphomicrobiales bacterium]